MELTPTLILNLVLLIVPPVALVLAFWQRLAQHIRWTVDVYKRQDRGEERELRFTQSGGAEDYYIPGTYLEADTSETLVLGVRAVSYTHLDVYKRQA